MAAGSCPGDDGPVAAASARRAGPAARPDRHQPGDGTDGRGTGETDRSSSATETVGSVGLYSRRREVSLETSLI